MPKRKVLILCTGNSCRSQMAEALINHDLGGDWQAFSAGIQPSGYVHPLAIKVLGELGIQHQGESKSTENFRGESFNVVITVCDDAAENCPVWLGKGKRVHIGFPDPAKVQGSETDRLIVFRRVCNNIRARIIPFLQDFAKSQNFPQSSLV